MLDHKLRSVKDRGLAPLTRLLANRVSVTAITIVSLVLCVGAGVAISYGHRIIAIALWLTGRLLDGLDGAVARHTGVQRDLGGYHDLLADTIGYAAVPLGIAAWNSTETVWIWCAILLATFYVNTISWSYLAAVATRPSSATSVPIASGLIEGTETIVLFTVMLAWPAQAATWFAIMAAGVALTVLQRLLWASKHLTDGRNVVGSDSATAAHNGGPIT